MKTYKEWLTEVLKIKRIDYGTNFPLYDNGEVVESFGFIYKTYFKHKDQLFSVDLYGTNIPKEMIESDSNIENYKNSIHFSLVKDGKEVSDRNEAMVSFIFFSGLIYIFKELLDNIKWKDFSVIAPLKDMRRIDFYEKSLFKAITDQINVKFTSSDEINLIENGGKAKRYKFVREN